jgi:hypothetical protein
MMSAKFTTRSELELFKALQKYGRISYDLLAQKTLLPKTTIQYAYQRLKKKRLFKLNAIPQLAHFSELPLALLSFTDLHPIRLKKLKQIYIQQEEVRILLTTHERVFMMLMHESEDQLDELISAIAEKAQAKPALCMISPTIAKLDLTIQDNVLDAMCTVLKGRTKRN